MGVCIADARIAAALSVLFNACTVVLAMLFYVVLPLQYVGDSQADALPALARHGAFHAMFSTMALPLIFIVIVIAFRQCFTIRTRSEIMLRAAAGALSAFLLLGLMYADMGLPLPTISMKVRN